MADGKVLLPEEPLWLDVCREYQGDIVRFATEVCCKELSLQQRRLLISIACSGARTSVSSGHGTGKTVTLSIVAAWHLLCFPASVMLITANDMDQLKVTFWKEFGATIESMRQGPFGWMAQHIFIGADNHCHVIGFQDRWFIESKTANAKTANKMAGRHGENFLIVVDEGSTVPDEVFSTLTGALTEEHNRMMITSQYTRNAGFFHRTQTELSLENGGEWDAIRLSSLDSPWVSDSSLIALWNSFDEDERRVRILGFPPDDSSKHMLSLRMANTMYARGRIISDDEPYGFMVSSDVALGEGLRDKSSIICGRVIGYGDTGPDARRVEVFKIPLFTNHIKSNSLAGHVLDEAAELSNATSIVDKGGIGGSVCQDIEAGNGILIPVLWGKPCWKKENNERFINQRAQATYSASRAAKEGRLSFLTLDHKRHVIAQASGIPKDHSANFRLKIPEKGSPAWEGRGSPDLWDAVCFFFLEGAQYIVAENNGAKKTLTASNKAKSAAEDMFKDLING